jgi:hypothetical protein
VLEEAKRNFVDMQTLADFIGVTPAQVSNLRNQGVIKSVKSPDTNRKSHFDFIPSVRALIIHYRTLSSARAPRKDETALDVEKLRRETIKRKTEELRYRTMKGDYHLTRDIDRVFGAVITRISITLRALPLRIARNVINVVLGMLPSELAQEAQKYIEINAVAEAISEPLDRALFELARFDMQTFTEIAGEYVEEVEGEAIEDDEAVIEEEPEYN